MRVCEDVHQRTRLTSRIPFHPREAPLPPPPLAGFMRGSPGIRRNSMHAGPRSGPFWGLPLREGKLSRRWGTRAPGGGGVREASSPLGPQPQMNRRGQGQDPPIQSRASRKIAPSELTRMAGVEPSKRRTEGFRDSVRPPR